MNEYGEAHYWTHEDDRDLKEPRQWNEDDYDDGPNDEGDDDGPDDLMDPLDPPHDPWIDDDTEPDPPHWRTN